MNNQNSSQHPQSVAIKKQAGFYRIVTNDSANWHLVANKAIARGEILDPGNSTFHIEVGDVEFVDITLKETHEQRRVYTAISAVPNNASCEPMALELPWCFMNHSCEPNTQDQWPIDATASLECAQTIALRDIIEGEELTYNYNIEQYDYQSPFRCYCGTEFCCETIRGFKHLNLQQQKHLFPFVSPFVKKNIKCPF